EPDACAHQVSSTAVQISPSGLHIARTLLGGTSRGRVSLLLLPMRNLSPPLKAVVSIHSTGNSGHGFSASALSDLRTRIFGPPVKRDSSISAATSIMRKLYPSLLDGRLSALYRKGSSLATA